MDVAAERFDEIKIMAELDAVRDLADDEPPRPIRAMPFVLRPPSEIEPRDWLFARLYIRGYVSATFGPGAGAKTMICLKDAVAMACGFDLDTREPSRKGPLRCWYVNVEDPLEEVERRLAAICLHYGITNDDLGGRLLVDTDREGRYLIAEQDANGLLVRHAVREAILDEIAASRIDVLVLDPLVHLHAVNENSNVGIAAVVAQLRAIADEGRVALHVVHHVRKGVGGEVGVEDGRGAGALKDACRAVRLMTPMSRDEASKFGLSEDESRFFVFANPSGKPNLAPPSDRREWFRLTEVALGNGRPDADQDRIGVPVVWKPPGAFDGVTLDDCLRIWARMREAQAKGEAALIACCAANVQSKGWAGLLVCDVLGWDASAPEARTNVGRMLGAWKASGAVREVRIRDAAKGRHVPVLIADANATTIL